MPKNDFSSLSLRPELLSSIQSLGYEKMTPIQAESLPILLSGKDLLAQAKTGSGKTAAFAISLLNKLEDKTYRTQALILCPTRELADQVSGEVRRLARAIPNIKTLTLCGGKPMGPQLASLERDAHIVVGTPGRILKHLEKGSLKLDGLTTLVLDEADRMLDMGFSEDIMAIIDTMPRQRQTLLFSATYPKAIKKISLAVQQDAVDLRVEADPENAKIKQVFYEIDKGDRTSTLIAMLEFYQPESTLVFCNRKLQCQELADDLWQRGFHALALHGDMEQYERDQVFVQFSNNSSSILIATDVAARGLDIKELPVVVNYDISPDPEVHIHRIGRTGRAGREGLALTIFTAAEKFRVKAIEEYQDSAVSIERLSSLRTEEYQKIIPPMVTLLVNGGRKDKVRAGDLLGALTADKTVSGDKIGKINIFDKMAYVAVQQSVAKQALRLLSEGKIKGRKFRARRLH